jgi:hypothetical protein
VLLVVLVLAACTPRGRPTAAPTTSAESTAAASEALPTPTPGTPAETDADEPPSEPPAGGPSVDVYFVREGGGQPYLEPVGVRLPGPTPAVARGALEHLLAATPADPDLVSYMPEGATLLGVDLDGRTLVVDLDLPDDGFNYGGPAEGLAVYQIVHTGAQFPTVARVRLLEEGRPLPGGHFDWSKPLKPSEEQVSPIVIRNPQHGASVEAGDVTVTGTANTFEATVGLRLLDPDGEVVDETFTTATCGTGCRGTWEHTFAGVQDPGTWTVEAFEDDPSGGEGRAPFTVARTFVVQ